MFKTKMSDNEDNNIIIQKIPKVKMTPEEKKEKRRYYNSLRTNRVRKNVALHHCDICNCDIKWDNMCAHRKTNKHKNNELKNVDTSI